MLSPDRNFALGKEILIVDDDREMCNVIAKFLKKQNYSVQLANSGWEGLSQLMNKRFDVVISDFRMPGMSGIQLIRKVKEVSPHTHIILITAFGDVTTYLDAIDAGAFDYINKPIRMRDLQRAIKLALQEPDVGNLGPKQPETEI